MQAQVQQVQVTNINKSSKYQHINMIIIKSNQTEEFKSPEAPKHIKTIKLKLQEIA